ncbi:MAG: hypothetical protein E2O68_00955 [Deltaproteobacteria bacterium]|nr:MAG: hypothetical protein E2O68_00955 [Deltaproteobacteria bacterium]
MKIFRCDTSPYQDPNFSKQEKQELETLALSYQKKIQNASVLLTNTLTDIENLKTDGIELIIHPNSGYDNFPHSFVKKADFPIVIGSEIRALAVSEYILSCLLGQVPFQKAWDRTWQGRSLIKDQQVLIIGMGKIGKIVKNSITPLVEKVWVQDPYKNEEDKVPLKEISTVILCAGLNETSHQMIDTKFLESLPPLVTIINAARGKLINQQDLITFLKNNPGSTAYLDVFEKEPARFEKLNLPNMFLTSHIAGVFDGLDNSIINFEKKVIGDFMNDRENFEKKYHDSILKNRIHDNILI